MSRAWLRACCVVVAALGVFGPLRSVAIAQYEPAGCLSADELELAELVNEYRSKRGRAPVALSRSLTTVAQWHAADVAYAIDVSGKWEQNPACNLHTWHGMPGQRYGSCCYTADHAKASCMWDKPGELTKGKYAGAGFENAAYGYHSARAAFDGFMSSPAHADVILNQGAWKGIPFKAMGIGVDPVHLSYFIWFGQDADPAGAPSACPSVQCPARPARSCQTSFGEALLTIDESDRGNEKLVAKWQSGPTIAGTAFGNPKKKAGTEYAVCVYDDRDALAAEYQVAAAGERCGGTSCWKRLGRTPKDPTHKGFTYLDRRSRHDGIRSLRLKAGRRGTTHAVVRGFNNASLGRRALPTGVASALRGSKRATIQLHASDAPLCLSARLGRITADRGKIFKAEK